MNSTKEKILLAACEVFAENCYEHSTISQICTKAGANVAAVNYHFGDKEKLYSQVWRYAVEQSEALLPFDDIEKLEPKDALYRIVLTYLKRIFSNGPASYFLRIMARELSSPTEQLGIIVQEVIKPSKNRTSAVVRKLMLHASDEQVHQTVMSIHSQFVFFAYNQPVRDRLHDMSNPLLADVEHLARHITDFSLGGMSIYQGESA